jgi:hypothetical protein
MTSQYSIIIVLKKTILIEKNNSGYVKDIRLHK